MKPIGFSTGALAKGDFARGIALQRDVPQIDALELSALRDHELPNIVDAIPHLDLDQFAYVSFHAPSKLQSMEERAVFALLRDLPEAWPVIVHPELLQTPSLWQELGGRLCLENMDNRKTTGRTVAEMRALFATFPHATFCLDLGHAQQIDPTMDTATQMLQEFGARLAELHISEVGPRGEHLPLGTATQHAFARIAHLVPAHCPLIIEAVVDAASIGGELETVSALFAT